MIDIEKLKQEAEEAQHALAKSLAAKIKFKPGCTYSDALALAKEITSAIGLQIALQAAEKEAEGKFPVYLHLQESGSWKMEPLNGMPNGGVSPIEYTADEEKHHVDALITEYPAPIADDGWIKWNGGECPVDAETLVKIEWRNGNTALGRAYHFLWMHDDGYDDIIAYRIIKPAADRVRGS